jgi:hypothetical protein
MSTTRQRKATGVAAIAARAEPSPAEPLRRKKASGSTVQLTLRLTVPQWEKLHRLALSERTSIQQLGIDGLSALHEKKAGMKL